MHGRDEMSTAGSLPIAKFEGSRSRLRRPRIMDFELVFLYVSWRNQGNIERRAGMGKAPGSHLSAHGPWSAVVQEGRRHTSSVCARTHPELAVPLRHVSGITPFLAN
jgi:hypothetical protein